MYTQQQINKDKYRLVYRYILSRKREMAVTMVTDYFSSKQLMLFAIALQYQFPANKTEEPNVGSMLVQRLWLWHNIYPTLGQCDMFAEKSVHVLHKIY